MAESGVDINALRGAGVLSAPAEPQKVTTGMGVESGLPGNLEQMTRETMGIGQELADKAFTLFNLGEATGGKPINVSQSGVEALLRRMATQGGVKKMGFEVKPEIEAARDAIDSGRGINNTSSPIYLDHLVSSFGYILSEMHVDGQRLSEFRGNESFIFGPTDMGERVYKQLDKFKTFYLTTGNVADMTSLLGKYDTFMSSMVNLVKIDSETGGNIAKRPWEEVYTKTPSRNKYGQQIK